MSSNYANILLFHYFFFKASLVIKTYLKYLPIKLISYDTISYVFPILKSNSYTFTTKNNRKYATRLPNFHQTKIHSPLSSQFQPHTQNLHFKLQYRITHPLLIIR